MRQVARLHLRVLGTARSRQRRGRRGGGRGARRRLAGPPGERRDGRGGPARAPLVQQDDPETVVQGGLQPRRRLRGARGLEARAPLEVEEPGPAVVGRRGRDRGGRGGRRFCCCCVVVTRCRCCCCRRRVRRRCPRRGRRHAREELDGAPLGAQGVVERDAEEVVGHDDAFFFVEVVFFLKKKLLSRSPSFFRSLAKSPALLCSLRLLLAHQAR